LNPGPARGVAAAKYDARVRRSPFLAALIVTALSLVAAPAAGARVNLMTFRHLDVRGGPETMAGRVTLSRIPSSFSLVSSGRGATQRLVVPVVGSCRGIVDIRGVGVATRRRPVRQFNRTAGLIDRMLGSGVRHGGGWNLAERPDLVPGTVERAGPTNLFGMLVVQVAKRRWLQMRVLTTYDGNCYETDRVATVTVAGVAQILRSARIEARVR
jgi:hypothetical protein